MKLINDSICAAISSGSTVPVASTVAGTQRVNAVGVTISDSEDSDSDDEVSDVGDQVPGKSTCLLYSVPDNVYKSVIRGKRVDLFKLLPGYGDVAVSAPSISCNEGTMVFRDNGTERKLARQVLSISQILFSLKKYQSMLPSAMKDMCVFIDEYILKLLDISLLIFLFLQLYVAEDF